jgi:phosphoribosylaminoimidazolecarboxamide formyltransferase/IMP cyclohydrolase
MADKYALFSVSDKTGIVPFAQILSDAGYGLISTGGTAQALRDGGLEVTEVADVTGFPEILDGRVKTLHPKIHGSVLARRELEAHRETLEAHDIPNISVVVVNLYPFRETIAKDDTDFQDAIENIDIGGPTLLRAAAKNHASMTVVVDPGDFGRVGKALADGDVTEELRRELAYKAFRHTASYDAAIVDYLGGELGDEEAMPRDQIIDLSREQTLRYGENPHQAAALYTRSGEAPLGGIEKLHGKALSYNNLVDLDAALAITREFDRPACSIIKHTNPAGCATGEDLETAYDRALACDPMSSFGGIVSLTRQVGASLAEKLNDHFFEIIAAPGFDDDALEVLTQKKNLRLLVVPESLGSPDFSVRATGLGYLLQQTDPIVSLEDEGIEVPTRARPTDEQLDGMGFLWKVCKHVKSNAIVLGKGTRTIGVGAGQMSRVDAVEIAVRKCNEDSAGSILASDAFFPFRDGIDAAAEAGVEAVIQPGGSRRDQEVIDACDEHSIAMVFTGHRHFRH